MHPEMIRNLTLTISIAHHRIVDLPVTSLLSLGRFKNIAQRRPADISLPLGNLFHPLPPAHPIEKSFDKRLASEKTLRDDLFINALGTDALPHEFAVVPLRRRPARSELSQHPVGRQGRVGPSLAGRAVIAAPSPAARMFRCFSSHGIEHHVAADFQQVALLLHQDSLVAPLKEVSDPPVPAVVGLGVNAVELSHADRELAVGSLDDQMVVVIHQAVGVADPMIAVADALKPIEEERAIAVVFEDGAPGVAAGG